MEEIDLNEQALVLSIEKRSNAKQGSASPDWMIELDIKALLERTRRKLREAGHKFRNDGDVKKYGASHS